MNFLNFIFLLSVLILSIFLYKFIQQPLVKICEMEKCPYCFGTDFCAEFKQNSLTLRKTSIFDLLINYLSVKNVFYALYKNSSVVLKKLGHNFELDRLDKQICTDNEWSDNCDLIKLNDTQDYLTKIVNFLNTSKAGEIKHFKICSITAIKRFIYLLTDNYNKFTINASQEIFLKNVWTILQLNAEPLLIQLLKSENNWPVPHYFGACGRIIVEDYCGASLNTFANTEWNIRAYLALQLLEAAVNFTERHPDFRIYLTDISPDNIAVNSELKVTFIDLENAIVTNKYVSGSGVHYSASFDTNDGFAFSEDDICASSKSDHNYFSVCKLLLSKDAPWPMMEGGLLHSPPHYILKVHPHLFEAIEVCAHQLKQMDCFQAVKKIIKILGEILS